MRTRFPKALQSSISSFFVALCFFLPSSGLASPELDRKYALETIGMLRAWDNVDGLFAEYVDGAFREYFSAQTRFRVQDLARANEVLGKSKVPYEQLITDPQVLGQLGRTLRVESLIRTRAYKEGPEYRFVIDWLHLPSLDLVATHSFRLGEPEAGKSLGSETLKHELKRAMDALIAQLPFQAQVNGRDSDWVTINIGRTDAIKRGDQLTIATVEEVKRHPLLGTLIDWRMVETGQVEVDSVDGGIAFGRVIAQEPGKQISRFQKVIRVVQAAAQSSSQTPPLTRAEQEAESEKNREREIARLGWFLISPQLGNFSRTISTSNGTQGKTGGGFYLGARADGQLWLTKEFFTELSFAYGFSGYTQQDIVSGAEESAAKGSSTFSHFSVSGGYNYYVTRDLYGPRGFAKVGYRSRSYSLPSVVASSLAPISFSSLFLGVGADLPIRGGYGVLLSFDIGVFKSLTQTELTLGTDLGVTDYGVFLGGYFRMAPKMMIRAGLDVQGNSADFLSSENLSHRVFTFAPALVYSF
jgi:hypothetical protein